MERRVNTMTVYRKRLAAIEDEIGQLHRKRVPFPRVVGNRSIEPFANPSSFSKSEKKELKALRRERRSIRIRIALRGAAKTLSKAISEYGGTYPYPYT